MFIFAGETTKIAIPENKIFNINLIGNYITINYDGGEIAYLSDSDSNAVAPKIETLRLAYDSSEIATDVMRSFYAACVNKEGAFYF